MGTYSLNANEIADAMEKSDVQGNCEGDFTQADFLLGAQIYLKRLRKAGAHIPRT